MSQASISELEARLAATDSSSVDPVERVDALVALAWALRNNDAPRGHDLATEARALAEKHGYPLGKARATRTMAMTIRDSKRLPLTFRLAEEARRLFDEVGDPVGRAAARDFLASLHEFSGDLAGGLQLALDALSIAREVGDPVRQGYALSNVGGILAASGEVAVGVEHLREALQLFEGAGDRAGFGAICSRLANVLKGAGSLDEAMHYAQLCREAAEESGDGSLRRNALRVIAELQDERGQLEEAEHLYRSLLERLTAEADGGHVFGGDVQVALGRLLLRRGKISEAEHQLQGALNQAAEDEDADGKSFMLVTVSAAHEALADLFERRGELPRAIEHLRRLQSVRERISQQDARNKLAQVEARAEMEAAKKDAEIHKLRFVELHGMQSKLVEAEKMALLGKLAAGMAHEFNTPIGVLRNNTDLSSRVAERLLAVFEHEGEISAQSKKLVAVLRTCADTSNDAMARITDIARSFGRFAELDQAERRTFDVREGLQSALSLLEPTLPERVRLESSLGDVPMVDGWPRELNHAFLTVLRNACEAIDGAGTVRAETSADDQHAVIRIRDTGRGMNEDQAAHLFDVAWSEDGSRTKMRLGLSAVHATTHKHGGTLEVESTPGTGTTITFRIPSGEAR